MPQFDTFIFSSSLCFLFISFFMLLVFNYLKILPRTSAILKLRYKITKPSENRLSNKNLQVKRGRYHIYTNLIPGL